MQSKISSAIIQNSNLVTDAPKDDDGYYVRHNGEWINIKNTNLVEEAPMDSKGYVRKNGLWVDVTSIVSSGGSNTPPTDEWTEYRGTYKINLTSDHGIEITIDTQNKLTAGQYVNLEINGIMYLIVNNQTANSISIQFNNSQVMNLLNQSKTFMNFDVDVKKYTTEQFNLKNITGIFKNDSIIIDINYYTNFQVQISSINIGSSITIEQPNTKKRILI